MIRMNGKYYPNDYVKEAVAAFLDSGKDPADFSDAEEIGYALETEKGILSVSVNELSQGIFVDLLANDAQCTAIGIEQEREVPPKIGGTRSLLLAAIEVPDSDTEAVQEPEMAKNCPRIFLYERFDDDTVSHTIFMDGNGITVKKR